MDARNNALTVAITVAVGGVVLAVALVGLARYRSDSPESIPSPAYAVPTRTESGRRGPSAQRPQRGPILVQDTERIQRLEKLLAEKNSQLNEKTALLNKREAEYRALKEELEQYAAIVSQWVGEEEDDSLSERSDPASGSEQSEAASSREELEAELQRVKEELNKTMLLEAAMEAEAARLQSDLEKAGQQSQEDREEFGREIAALAADAQAARQAAAETLRRIGGPAVPALIEMLAAPQPDTRRWAADMLGALGPDARDAIPSLIDALADSDEGVRSRALEALNAIRD